MSNTVLIFLSIFLIQKLSKIIITYNLENIKYTSNAKLISGGFLFQLI